MSEITIFNTKLTELQENILIELNKTYNIPFICKKLSIKPITLTRTIQALTEKDFLKDNILTEKGKKMVHYLEFKNDTISLFLNKINIESTIENISQISKLDYKIIVALRNLI